MNSTDFYYNGEYSVDKGIYLVKLDSGFITDPFLPESETISDRVPGNDTPYYYETRKRQLRVPLIFSCLEGYWTLEKRREIARWLDTKNYEEFYSADDVDKRYYLKYDGGIDLQTNGNQQGYIEVNFINIDESAYSPIYVDNYDLSTITEPTTIEFNNDGDDDLLPELQILKYGAGDFKITNLTNGGKVFLFSGLNDQETVYIDNKLRHIETDIPDFSRFDSFNGNYLDLVYGVNTLQIEGAAKLTFRYQYKIKG